MLIPVHQIIFFVFAAIVVIASLMVVISRNPVRAALFLVLAFVASAVLWMMLQAEFLALALIFVYVGAVMTLFLFVVMMLNADIAALREGFVRYLPFGVIIMALLIGLLLYVIGPAHLHDAGLSLQHEPAGYSNVTAMGMLLFTHYLYPFELAALILLVAIIASISLAFFGRKPGTRSQKAHQQLQATKANRLRVVSMEEPKE
jgi:NADH-quinone oxidoreductase subunit J